MLSVMKIKSKGIVIKIIPKVMYLERRKSKERQSSQKRGGTRKIKMMTLRGKKRKSLD